MTGVAIDFRAGDRVSVAGYGCKGKVRWVGTLPGDIKVRIGVELDAPHGKNNGAVRGTHFFKCKPNCGVFTSPHKLSHTVVKVKSKPIPDMLGLAVGLRCRLTKYRCNGTIRWTGTLPHEKEYKVGIELDRPVGKNNGVIRNRFRLFRCSDMCGVLTKPEEVNIVMTKSSIDSRAKSLPSKKKPQMDRSIAAHKTGTLTAQDLDWEPPNPDEFFREAKQKTFNIGHDYAALADLFDENDTTNADAAEATIDDACSSSSDEEEQCIGFGPED